MTEHEHCDHEQGWQWWYDWEHKDIRCRNMCGEILEDEEILEVLNNPTVKTIINVVIARRDEDNK